MSTARDAAPEVRRVADLEALGSAVAGAAIEVLRARQASGGIPYVVLTGGRAGAQVLTALAAHPERDSVDWRRVGFLWGDERWLPAGDAERNDRLADESLFSVVRTDPDLVRRIAPSDAGRTLDDAAAAYARVLAGIDRIDLALNGVGEDGHVASLFPGRPELLRNDAGVPAAIAVRNSPKPPPERVSLSLPSLTRADRVWLLASGAGKAEAVEGVLNADPAAEPLPAARLTGRIETLIWADDAALGAGATTTR